MANNHPAGAAVTADRGATLHTLRTAAKSDPSNHPLAREPEQAALAAT